MRCKTILFSTLKKHYDSRQAGMTTFYDFIKIKRRRFAPDRKIRRSSFAASPLFLFYRKPRFLDRLAFTHRTFPRPSQFLTLRKYKSALLAFSRNDLQVPGGGQERLPNVFEMSRHLPLRDPDRGRDVPRGGRPQFKRGNDRLSCRVVGFGRDWRLFCFFFCHEQHLMRVGGIRKRLCRSGRSRSACPLREYGRSASCSEIT